MDAFLGTILIWPMNWAPQGWLLCNGALLNIQQYTALYSLLGNTYGGDGRSNFALPDMRGRMPVGMGQGPGLTPREPGQHYGDESVTLNAHNMPAHTHTLSASNTASDLTQAPANNWTPGAAASVSGDSTPVITPVNMYAATPTAPVQSAPSSIEGNNMPFSALPPALVMNFIICVEGLYPSRP